MPLILPYASPQPRPTLRPCIGACATLLAACASTLVIASTFLTRYALASYVSTGRCGTHGASLELQLYTLPSLLFIPCAVGAAVGHHLQCKPAVCRVSVTAAGLGWATCAFVG
jgi:hypothetical protein